MIIVDFTQVAIGSLMVALHRGEEAGENLLRHIILNNLRYYKKRFSEKYGDQMVLCCDSKHYWRRDYFPHYKANRKVDREKSDYDWNVIFESLNKMRDELKEYFPYKVLEVYGAEADDIVAVLVKNGKLDGTSVIISSDKDFIQLHGYRVDQYSPMTKKMINGKDPVGYLREHILKGDRSDGVPNILSEDDTFVTDKRQKPMRKVVIGELMEAMHQWEPEKLFQLAKCPKDTWVRNWQRNQTLIDFSYIPKNIQQDISEEFDNQKPVSKDKLYKYFIEHDLNDLVNNIGEF